MINTVRNVIKNILGIVVENKKTDNEILNPAKTQKFESPKSTYIGVPAPVYLENDEWFGSSIKSEKQLMHVEDAQRLEKENPKEETKEPSNIHQMMYDIATKGKATTLALDPPGGSENFQEGWQSGSGWHSGNGYNQFRD
jgi:hypothetical protein